METNAKQLEFNLLDFLFKDNVTELYQTINNSSNVLDSYLGVNNFTPPLTIGLKSRYKNNIKAIKVIYELNNSLQVATKEQLDILSKFTGWGGLAPTFDVNNLNWQKEYLELQELLTPKDYKLANASILSAYYTPPYIIEAIYKGLTRLGFNKGNILEPSCGIGNFFSAIPSNFNVNLYGVEIDSITAKIAKHLHKNAQIQICGYEHTNFPNYSFDAVITNVPFGDFKVYDKAYEKYNLFIHDYFILKSLDKLRDGGLGCFITTKGTLDKANPHIREMFASKANLLGAIRLPSNAFNGTSVTTDILFFQKINTPNSSQPWLNINTNQDGININQYYIDNPHMVLGKMVQEKSMYGDEDETTCKPDGRDLSYSLLTAIEFLPQDIFTNSFDICRLDINTLDTNNDIPNYCYGVINGIVYFNVDGELTEQNLPISTEKKLKAMINLRQLTRYLLNIQVNDCLDDELKNAQNQLNFFYDNFVKAYGCINLKDNRRLFSQDADFTLLLSLENYDSLTQTATKADIFTKRTICKYVRPEFVEDSIEALYISKNETGKIDIKLIEKLTNKSFETIIYELSRIIYLNPALACDDKYIGWEMSNEYLSGNVKEKLRIAQSAVNYNELYKQNIEALLKVQPIPLTANEISVRLGANWIPANIYKEFIAEKFKLSVYAVNDLSIIFSDITCEWKIESNYLYKTFEVVNTYGTDRMNAYRIFEHSLNLRVPSIYDKIDDKRILNKTETIAVRERQRKLQNEFKLWIFDEPTRRNLLLEIYNERFNNTVLPSYDGSYLIFPEMNPNIILASHQKDAVERGIVSGNMLLHHVVGAGKTFSMATLAMKLRQLKLAQKPLIVVPNHLVMQFSSEFRKLYPTAKLLMASKRDFEKEQRLKFVSRIATGEWDTVIIAMSQFEMLPISNERQERKILDEIENIETALREMNKTKGFSVRDLQKVLKNKQAMLEKLTSSKKDSLIKFEDLGIDYLFIDEADKYKNKFIFTKMNNVAGLSKTASKRATDLDNKIDYIQELHNYKQKGVVFATGTPISNSMVEMYTMQSYLAKNDLVSAGLRFFDDWAVNFGETVTALELAPSGQGYRTKTRFAKFVNLPELLKMYRSFADVKTADMLKLNVPKVDRRVISIKPTDEILTLNDEIIERAENITNGSVDPCIDNMLKITTDGKKLALDPRLLSSSLLDNPANKVNVCVEQIYKAWNATINKRSTQLVFCDLSTPKKKHSEYIPNVDFDVYNHLKTKLVELGIPENEVAFIHDANSDLAKQTIFDLVRCGKIRILIGSTEKCGAGTNIQNKLIAIHHLDTPYRPRDLEQREGRGIRQGNENHKIAIFTYVTEKTFDAYCYQILENKQRFISQINNGDLSIREASDIDEMTLSYAEIKAITSANPLIKRKYEIENQLSQLQTLQNHFNQNRYQLQDHMVTYLPKSIDTLTQKVNALRWDIVIYDGNKTKEFSIDIGGKVYTERSVASQELYKQINNYNVNKIIAKLYGFDIIVDFQSNLLERKISLSANGVYPILVSESAIGTLTRLENFLEKLNDTLNTTEQTLKDRHNELQSTKEQLQKPFEHNETIVALSSELVSIDAELNLDKQEIAPVIDENDTEEIVTVDSQDIDESMEYLEMSE
jgi:N12 class adenine-specific DNA methylase